MRRMPARKVCSAVFDPAPEGRTFLRSAKAIWFLMVVIASVGCSKGKTEPTAEERIRQLEECVEQERQNSGKAVEAYVLKVKGRIDDLAAPAADILRQLPGVAHVEFLVAAPKPTHLIIRLRDWHALDLRQAAGKPLSDEEVDGLHAEHLLEVELVQLEQATVLKCLTKHHRLRRVLCEGLTAQGVAVYKAKVDALRELDRRLPDLRRQLRELSPEQREGLEKEVDGLDNEVRRGLVELGAPARLLLAGNLDGVLPLDDEDALRQSNPGTPDGRIKEDHDKVRAREDATVKLALDNAPFSLLILEGDHDLSKSVRRASNATEYVRVTTTRYKEVR
jgi:hypothetical protein